MKEKVQVLHISAHLGGGIGKAISGLVLHTPADSPIEHVVICLEQPEKKQFLEQIIKHGTKVVIDPCQEELSELISDADIVQLEWWGHPVTIAAICCSRLPPMRLLLWCHVSGLFAPIIPARLIELSHHCLFTSPCSYDVPELKDLPPDILEKLDVVHSCLGFDGLSMPDRTVDEPLKAGYLGTQNFAKFHPDYVKFMSAVPFKDFTVTIVGDTINKEVLENQCTRAGRPGMLQFKGYSTNIASDLAEINVFPYLLNPRHYGTSENALLEAMTMGVVPIVLNNPAENCLVRDGKTGLIINSPEEFAHAIVWLKNNPGARLQIGQQAAKYVQDHFPPQKMISSLQRHYLSIMDLPKKQIDFQEVFGSTPTEWFLRCQRTPEVFLLKEGIGMIDYLSKPGFLERTKGSVYHFKRHSPHDGGLQQLAESLESIV